MERYGTAVLRIHDTAAGALVELQPREPGKVSMYVCGPTVYDVPHIGHGRFNLVWDVLRRYLEWEHYEVRYVSNIMTELLTDLGRITGEIPNDR